MGSRLFAGGSSENPSEGLANALRVKRTQICGMYVADVYVSRHSYGVGYIP